MVPGSPAGSIQDGEQDTVQVRWNIVGRAGAGCLLQIRALESAAGRRRARGNHVGPEGSEALALSSSILRRAFAAGARTAPAFPGGALPGLPLGSARASSATGTGPLWTGSRAEAPRCAPEEEPQQPRAAKATREAGRKAAARSRGGAPRAQRGAACRPAGSAECSPPPPPPPPSALPPGPPPPPPPPAMAALVAAPTAARSPPRPSSARQR